MKIRTEKEQWLDQVKEAALEPERPICDPHHHLWDHPDSRYMLDEILADTSEGHRVVSTVFVECSSMYRAAGAESQRPVGETEFVQGIAAMSASGGYGDSRIAAGIVSFADLTLGESVRDVLTAHRRASENRFRGIRHATGWHDSAAIRNSHTRPTNHLMLSEGFHEGLGVLGDMNLSFDAWCYHHQIEEFVALAKSNPGILMILDHFAGPLGIGPYDGRAAEVFEHWQKSIVQLESCSNVFFKLGGINMKINGFGWHKRPKPPTSDELVAATRHYYDFCIDHFGAERCMFESNFPVDKESVSYGVLWNAFKKIAAKRTTSEQDWLFHNTAAKAYRLDEAL